MGRSVTIVDNLIKRHGLPKEIRADNGKKFANCFIKDLYSEYNMVWRYVSPYNPTTTGLVERFNRTLVGKLRKITEFERFDRARCVENPLKFFLISFHRGKGCSPYESAAGQLITSIDRQEGWVEGRPKSCYEDCFQDIKGKYLSSFRKEEKEGDKLFIGYKVLHSHPYRVVSKLDSI
jgi:transposase InsO family protein